MTDKFLDQIKENLQAIKNVGENNDNKFENNWYVFDDWVLNYLYPIDMKDILDYITENNGNYFSAIPRLIDIKDRKNLYEGKRFDNIVL